MNQEVFDKEITELKVIIDNMIVLLEKGEGNKRYGWTMKREKIKWKIL